MYNFFYRVQSFTQVKNYMTLLAPISSFSFGFQSTQISEKNERTILSRELTHRTNMSSSYFGLQYFVMNNRANLLAIEASALHH